MFQDSSENCQAKMLVNIWIWAKRGRQQEVQDVDFLLHVYCKPASLYLLPTVKQTHMLAHSPDLNKTCRHDPSNELPSNKKFCVSHFSLSTLSTTGWWPFACSDVLVSVPLLLWVGSESSWHVTPMRRQYCWTSNACMGLLQTLERKWLTECNQCAVNHEISEAKWFHTESLRTPQEILLYWSHLSCATECSAGSSFLYYPLWWFHNITAACAL